MSDSNRAKFNLSAANCGEVAILDYVALRTDDLVYRYLFLLLYPHFCDLLKVAEMRFYFCFVGFPLLSLIIFARVAAATYVLNALPRTSSTRSVVCL